jgi:hypothetical protein
MVREKFTTVLDYLRFLGYDFFNAGIAQLVEQWTENPRVRGSIPRPGI